MGCVAAVVAKVEWRGYGPFCESGRCTREEVFWNVSQVPLLKALPFLV